MDKRNWYTGQVVQESHLDEAFDNVESSIRSTYADAGIVGITSGLGVTAGGGTKQVVLATGVAYDSFGRRIYIPSVQTLTLTVDSSGNPITNPSGSNVRWVSVFVKFEVEETGLSSDPEGNEILTRTLDSFDIVIKQAAEAPAVSAGRATAESDEVRVADVKLVNSTTTFSGGDIDLDTADVAFQATSLDGDKVGGKTLDAALTAIYQGLETRIVDIEEAIADPGQLPPPTGDANFPRRDSDLGTSREASFTSLDGYLRLLEQIPVRHRKLTNAISVPGADITVDTLTDNEHRSQIAYFENQNLTSGVPTAEVPCLIFRLHVTSTRYLRFYTSKYGFIFTYNAYILNPDDPTIQWKRDDTAGSDLNDDSWAITTRTFDLFDSAGMFSATPKLMWYKQGFGEADIWDFNDWEDFGDL